MNNINLEEYLNVITSQFRTKPNYMSFVEAILRLLTDVSDMLDGFDYKFDLNFAEGEQLDLIGKIVGASRNMDFVFSDGTSTLSDEEYRLYLKSVIAQNHWNGTLEDILELWSTLFPGIELKILDNQDMSCIIYLADGNLSAKMVELLKADKLIPRPAGVRYIYTFGENYIFAFDMDEAPFKGWDKGYFLY
jgi:hypothetical protein